MARKKGSSDAAKKRSIARRFNDSLVGRTPRARREKTLDRRTARRLDRYRAELKKGKKNGDKVLTPLDVAVRVHELLNFGDRLADIRKLSKPREIDYDGEALVRVLKEMHPIYQFRPEAYRYAGVTNESLVAAGVLDKMPTRRGPAPRAKTGEPAPRKRGARKPRK